MANKSNTIDITKIGPASFRALQEANNSLYSSNVSPEFREYINNIRNNTAPISQYDASIHAKQDVSSPLIGQKDYWGSSMFDDDTATAYQFENLADIRANNQPWYAKVGAGLAKGVVLAGTTFLDGTVGLLLGGGQAFAEKRLSALWDNPFSKAMQGINELSEELLPNYYTEAEKTEPWYENVFTANFLGDKFIKNLGFTVGALYSGGLASAGLKGGMALAQATKLGSKAIQGASNLAKTMKLVKSASQFPSMVTSGVGATISAINEGRIEALNNSTDWYNTQRLKIDDLYISRIKDIADKYGINFEEPSDYIDEESYLKYQEEVNREKKSYEETLAKLNEDKLKMGNMDLLFNLPILMASNIVQFGRMYANGFKTARKSTNIVGKVGEYTSGRTAKGGTLRAVGNALSEGAEEISQGAVATIAGLGYEQDVMNFYKSRIDPKAEKQTIDWMKAFSQGINETVNEGSSWEEFSIGFLTGALGVPVFGKSQTSSTDTYVGRNKKIGLRGGIFGELLEQKEARRRDNEVANYLNNRIQSPEFINYYQGLIRHNKYQNDMNQAVENNDEFEFKNSEYAQLVSDITMFDNAGKLEDYKTLINSSFDISDENLASIVENTTAVLENGELVGPFSQYAIKNEDGTISANFGDESSKQNIINKLTQTKNDIFSTIDKYVKIKDEIDIRTGQQLSDEQLEELTWLKSQIGNWQDRATQLSSEVKPTIGTVLDSMSQLANMYNNIKVEEGASHPGLSDKYREADENEKKLRKNISILNTVRGLDDKTFAYLLSRDPKLVKDIKSVIENPFSGVEADEAQTVNTKIDDIVKLANGTELFNTKLKEYLENPSRLQEDLDSATEEVIDSIKEEDNKKYKESIDKASSFKALQDIEEESGLQEEVLNKTNNPLVKEYKKAKKFKAELDAAIDKSDYSDKVKNALHQIADIRFNKEQNLSDLINSSLVTEYYIEADDDIVSGETLAPFIDIAKNNIEKSNIPEIDTSTIKSSESATTGSDSVSTVPVKNDNTNVEKLTDIVKTSKDETVNSVVIPLINKTEELVRKAIDSKEETDIEKAYKSLNQLERELVNLTEYNSNTEFRNKIDSTLEYIYNKLPQLNPDVTETELLDNITKDEESEEKEEDSKKPKEPHKYYRSALNMFTIDSFKDGTFILFKDKFPDYKAVYDKIEFDYINKGNIKKDDTINLKIEKVGDYDVVFMYHNNHIVGVLPNAESSSYIGIKGITERLSKGEDVNLTVSKIMLGRYKFTKDKTRFIKDVSGTEGDIKFGVVSPIKGRPTLVTNRKDINAEPVFNELHSDGKVYILLPNSRGTYSPKLLRIKHFNREEFNLPVLKDSNNTRAKEIHRILDALSKADNPDKVDDLTIELGRVLHIKGLLHINMVNMGNNTVLTLHGKAGRKNIVIERGSDGSMELNNDGTITYSQPKRVPSESIYNDILEYLYTLNPVFNIRASKVNTGNYNQDLINDDLLYTHITDANMVGSWFTTNWYDDNGVEQKAINPKGRFVVNNKKEGVKVYVGGKQYYVNKGIVYDVHENEVTTNTQLIKDLAYCEDLYGDKINGSTMDNNKVLLPNGTAIDRVNQRYLTPKEVKELKDKLEGRPSIIENANATLKKLQEDQNKVKRNSDGRPDTSENENGESVYRILEEDGQYHEYKRVHSIIGSNWLTKFSSSDKESSALKWGTLVDDICREYFGGNTNITKPKEMSDAAFGSLMKRLENIKSYLEKTGEKFLVNRIVIFKKLPDGTRVAGELDALSFNEITGNFNIYDFKTSKRTFHASGNSRDLYRTKGSSQTKSDFEQHSTQLSAYKNIFDSSYNSSINSLWVIPFVLNYDTNNLNQIVGEQTIPLNYIPEAINTGKVVMPNTPPVVDPTRAALNPKSLNDKTRFKEGDKVTYTTKYNSGTGTVVGFTDKLVKVRKDEGDNLVVSYPPELLNLIDTTPVANKKDNSNSSNETLSNNSTLSGETSYFELNGEVVTAPTTIIGEVNGYTIRMYKEAIQTSGYGGNGAGTLYNYYAVFPNGNTFKIVNLSKGDDEDVSKEIMNALGRNPSRVKQMSEVTTKVGSYKKPSKLAEAQARLQATNKSEDSGSPENIGNPQPKLNNTPEMENSDNKFSENAYKSWEELDETTQQVLNLSGFDSTQWNSLPPKERDTTINCLGI